MLRAFLIAALLLICGCASIPISTAFRLSAMDQRTLLGLDPRQVRVRVAVPAGFDVDVQKTRLTLSLSDDQGRYEHHPCALTLLRKTDEVRAGGLFHADYPVVAYELALDPSSVESIVALQGAIAPHQETKVGLAFTTEFSAIPADSASVRFWVDIKLKQSEACMVLFDGAELKMPRAGS